MSRAAQASTGGRTAFDVGAELLEAEKVPYRQDGPVLVRFLGYTARPSFNPSGSHFAHPSAMHHRLGYQKGDGENARSTIDLLASTGVIGQAFCNL